MSQSNNKKRKTVVKLQKKRQRSIVKRNAIRNDGKSLERLVQIIEASLLPKGFKVTPNVKVGDDAEFDIVIEGVVGSSSIKWLVECRDRPSHGSAPASWIEQLITRRDRFHFDKVIAVSSTGFARSAIKLAKERGIVLRSVSRIEQVGSDIAFTKVNLKEFKAIFGGKVTPSYTNIDAFLSLPLERRPSGPTLRIRFGSSHSFISFGSYIGHVLDHSKEDVLPDEWYDLKLGGKVLLSSEGSDELQTDGFEITKVKLYRKVIEMDALVLKEYSEVRRLIGRQLDYETQTSDGVLRRATLWQVLRDGEWKSVLFNSNIPRPRLILGPCRAAKPATPA